MLAALRGPGLIVQVAMSGSPEPLQPSLQRLITPERRLEALQHVNRRSDRLSFFLEWAKIIPISVFLFFGINVWGSGAVGGVYTPEPSVAERTP